MGEITKKILNFFSKKKNKEIKTELEIKEKVKSILKESFKIEMTNDKEEIFHHLDSINYFRYIIIIEKNFNVNVSGDILLRTVDDTVNFLCKK